MIFSRTGGLDVVIVDEELRVGISRARRLEGDGDVADAETIVEDERSVSTIVVEWL